MKKPKPRMREYTCWVNMKQRVSNPNDINYERYGGKGIRVCKSWWDSFDNFLADVGLSPTSQHTIDRINNAGNYEPNNVRWATYREQNRNRGNFNRLVTYKRRTQCLTAWAEELGIKLQTLNTRLRRGWSVNDAFTRPVVEKRYV